VSIQTVVDAYTEKIKFEVLYVGNVLDERCMNDGWMDGWGKSIAGYVLTIYLIHAG